FIYRLGGNVVAENITNIVQNMMNLEYWTSREVTMFITIMDEIPIETLFIIVNRLLKKRNLYSASDGYNSPYSKKLINTILLCV
ncbi:Rgg/GadR/MutR family transcriptional regulator, partial [Enterococcus faecalis]